MNEQVDIYIELDEGSVFSNEQIDALKHLFAQYLSSSSRNKPPEIEFRYSNDTPAGTDEIDGWITVDNGWTTFVRVNEAEKIYKILFPKVKNILEDSLYFFILDVGGAPGHLEADSVRIGFYKEKGIHEVTWYEMKNKKSPCDLKEKRSLSPKQSIPVRVRAGS